MERLFFCRLEANLMIFPAENLGFRGSRGSLAIESGRPAAVVVGACIITLDRLVLTLLF